MLGCGSGARFAHTRTSASTTVPRAAATSRRLMELTAQGRLAHRVHQLESRREGGGEGRAAVEHGAPKDLSETPLEALAPCSSPARKSSRHVQDAALSVPSSHRLSTPSRPVGPTDASLRVPWYLWGAPPVDNRRVGLRGRILWRQFHRAVRAVVALTCLLGASRTLRELGAV